MTRVRAYLRNIQKYSENYFYNTNLKLSFINFSVIVYYKTPLQSLKFGFQAPAVCCVHSSILATWEYTIWRWIRLKLIQRFPQNHSFAYILFKPKHFIKYNYLSVCTYNDYDEKIQPLFHANIFTTPHSSIWNNATHHSSAHKQRVVEEVGFKLL